MTQEDPQENLFERKMQALITIVGSLVARNIELLNERDALARERAALARRAAQLEGSGEGGQEGVPSELLLDS